MKNRGFEVFCSIVLGAFIGATVAHSHSNSFGWAALGIALGGVIGYFIYDWRKVVAAVPAAYRAACGWKLDKIYLAKGFWLFVYFGLMSFWIAMGFFAFNLLLWGFGYRDIQGVEKNTIAVFGTSLVGIVVVVCLFFPLNYSFGLHYPGPSHVSRRSSLKEIISIRSSARALYPSQMIFHIIPRAVSCVARWMWKVIAATVFGLLAFTCKVPGGLVAFGKFIPRFFWRFFLEIHTDARRICGTYAAAGAAIGFFTWGTPGIFAIVAGFIGLADYLTLTPVLRRRYIPVPVRRS